MSKIDKYNSSGAPIDYQQMTIEHIFPQSKARSEPRLTILNAMIGNLILVDEHLNKKLGNKPFPEKQKILGASWIWIDAVLKGAQQWKGKEILDRTDFMAELAYNEVWKIK